MKLTRQGQAVLALVEASDSFQSAGDIHLALGATGVKIGLATVYRTLQLLADNKMVDVLPAADGTLTYRRCIRNDHHHHLICRHCGKTIEIDMPTIEKWAAGIGKDYGFTDIDHTIELRGTCNACQMLRAG